MWTLPPPRSPSSAQVSGGSVLSHHPAPAGPSTPPFLYSTPLVSAGPRLVTPNGSRQTADRPVSAVPQLTPGSLSAAAAVRPLFQRLQAPPPARLYLRLRKGVRPVGQRAGPTLCAMGGQGGRSPLRPTLERGPHQGSELRLLGLHIRSLTAVPAFRHLVRRPGPAGPDIRLAHGVLWAAPTLARNHARARARRRRRLPPSLPAPHALSPAAAADGRGLDSRRRRLLRVPEVGLTSGPVVEPSGTRSVLSRPVGLF